MEVRIQETGVRISNQNITVMRTSKSFKELVVWQKAHQFVLMIYRTTKQYPKDERFCLIIQFRRAVISIAANISEGYKKRTKPDKIRMLNIAQGSLEECKYYCLLGKDLGYHSSDDLEKLSEEVSKLLTAYVNAIENSK